MNSGQQAIVETNKVSDVDEVTNTGSDRRSPSVKRAERRRGASTGAKANKPGERLRTAFEGTVDRIEKGFDDAVKGFDNALKGLSGRDKSDKRRQGRSRHRRRRRGCRCIYRQLTGSRERLVPSLRPSDGEGADPLVVVAQLTRKDSKRWRWTSYSPMTSTTR